MKAIKLLMASALVVAVPATAQNFASTYNIPSPSDGTWFRPIITPAQREQRVERLVQLRTMVAAMVAEGGGSLTTEQQRHVRRQYLDICGRLAPCI